MEAAIFKQEKSEHPGRYIFYIFLIALALRIVFFTLMLDFPLLYFQSLDETYYVDLGKVIASGSISGGQGAFFMDPLYGYFLGFIFFLFGDDLTIVRLVQILLDSFNVLIIFAIGRRVWDRQAGTIAAIIWATYAVSFYYTLLMLKVTLAVSGLLLFTLLFLKVIENHRMIGWLLAGIAAGVLNYIRANFILMIPLTMVFYYFIERPSWRYFLKNCSCFLAGAMVLLSFNGIRNFAMTGNFSLLITQSGRMLYSCNNPENTTGLFDVPSFSQSHPVASDQDFHNEAERRACRSLSSKEVSNYWQNETFRVLKDNPRIIPVLILNKLKWTLANYEVPMNQSYRFAAEFSGVDKWPGPNYAFVMALGLPGLAIGLFRKRQVWLLLVPVLTILATLTIFCVSSRFRIPMVPFLAIGTGIFLQTIWGWGKRGYWRKVILLGLISAALFLISMMISPPAGDGHKEFGLAKAYFLQQDDLKAKSLTLKAIKKFPDNLDLYILLGRIARKEGQLDQSKRYYQSAMKINSDNFTVNYDLAMLYMDAGKPELAIPYLEKSLTLKHYINSIFYLARAYDACGDSKQAMKYYNEFLKSVSPDGPGQEYARNRLSAM